MQGTHFHSRFNRQTGMAYVAILVLMMILSSMGIAFLHKVGVEVSVTANQSESIQAEYLAESAANHALWRLMNEGGFPASETTYYMHAMAGGQYGYKVRRHTSSTFATVASVGVKGDAIIHQSYVLNMAPFVATGSYWGNYDYDRQITGLGFQPEVVIVKGDLGQPAVIKTSNMPGGLSKRMAGDESLQYYRISSLDSDGFTVRDSDIVNKHGVTYHWIAFRGASRLLKVGYYTGNGWSNRVITGVGFDPALVMVMSEDNKRPMIKFPASSQSHDFGNENGKNDCIITPVPADGFRISDNDRVNDFGVRYYYICWAEAPGLQTFGSYTGDGKNKTDITGLGLEPVYLMVRCLDEGREMVHASPTLDMIDSSMFFKNKDNDADRIEALFQDGFTVGNDDDVNKSGNTYGYAAWSRN